MSIPTSKQLRVPVLHMLSDAADRTSEDIKDLLAPLFEMSPDEFVRKGKNNQTIFLNHVSWALVYLGQRRAVVNVGGPAPRKREGGTTKTYRITDYGLELAKKGVGYNPF